MKHFNKISILSLAILLFVACGEKKKETEEVVEEVTEEVQETTQEVAEEVITPNIVEVAAGNEALAPL